MQKSFVKEFKLYCKKKNLDVNSHQIKLIKKLEEYSGLEGTAVFDYCAKIGVIDMATES